MVTYRKAKDGRWVAFGPTSEVHVGSITISKKDGSSKIENVASLGKSFDVNGTACCYGYLAEKTEQAPQKTSRPRNWSPCGYPGCPRN